MFRYCGCTIMNNKKNQDTEEEYPFVVISTVSLFDNLYVYDVFDSYEDAKRRFDDVVEYDRMSLSESWRVFASRFCKFKNVTRIKGFRIGEYYELDQSGYARYVHDRTEEEEIYYKRYYEALDSIFESVIWPLEGVEKLVNHGLGNNVSIESEDVKEAMLTLGIKVAYGEYLMHYGGIEREEKFINDMLSELSDLRESLGISCELSTVKYLENLYVNYRSRLNKELEKRGIPL